MQLRRASVIAMLALLAPAASAGPLQIIRTSQMWAPKRARARPAHALGSLPSVYKRRIGV